MKGEAIPYKMLSQDAYSQWLGIEIIECEIGRCKVAMTIRKDMLNRTVVELDSQYTFREFLNLIRAKSNSDHIGVVFSDSDDRFHVKLQIEECSNGPNSKI